MKQILIPTGNEFLPKTGIPYIKKIQKKEQNHKAQTRLLAYIMRKEGSSIRDICKAFNKSYSTVRHWLLRAMQSGVGGRYDIKNKGASSKLDKNQIKQLRVDLLAGPQKCGFESGLWTARLLAEHIKRKFGVQYGTSGIYDMLRRIGFTQQTPRPRHHKSASKSQKEAFKKKQNAPPHTIAPVATP